MIDAFSLATAELAFGSRFFADDATPTSKSTADAGDGMGFISSVAKSFVKSRKDKPRTFKSPPRPRPRTVSQLTRGNKFTNVAMSPTKLIGGANPDLQVAMRRLTNATNRDVIQLIPLNVVSPKINQGPTLGVDAPKLGKIT